MRKWIRTALAVLLFGGHALAQAPGQTNEGLTINQDPSSGAFSLSWWAKAGRTYFIQQSSDLVNWTFMPLMEAASPDQLISWGFTSSSNQLFLRLQYIDESFADWEASQGLDPSVWADPTALDPAGNGLTLLQCFQNGYNPFDWYKGQAVTLAVLSGGGQTGAPRCLSASTNSYLGDESGRYSLDQRTGNIYG
jgi:hypothetical protein